jgi:dihydroorotate dehydrogenase electron transfer subunit
VEILSNMHLMWIEAPDIASSAQPGQFITVRCEDFPLRRPFSIHQVAVVNEAKQPQTGEGSGGGGIAILFQIVGEGTLWLSQRQRGEKIDVLGPLGNGFTIETHSRNLLLAAGGIGVAPLIFLAQRTSSWHSVTLIHGASTAAQLYPLSSLRAKRSNLLPLLDKVKFIPITEDSTMGKRGVVTDILPDFLDWADQIYACGPIDMYKAMSTMSLRAERSNLKKCQVSLEVRLGCGIGACYGCTVNTRKGLKRVCRDGPIFELDDILWKEVKIWL